MQRVAGTAGPGSILLLLTPATHEFLPLSCPALQDEGVSTGRYRTSVCALPLVNAPGLAEPVAQPEGEPVAAQ